jgi:hypothetical protein
MLASVPESAIGNPSAALVATALWMRTLHQPMNGTDRKPPPAPTIPDTVPITAPAPNIPARPGSSRVACGFLFHSICVAENATNSANTSASSCVSICLPIHGPIHDPTTIPGAISATTRHSTAPCR